MMEKKLSDITNFNRSKIVNSIFYELFVTSTTNKVRDLLQEIELEQEKAAKSAFSELRKWHAFNRLELIKQIELFITEQEREQGSTALKQFLEGLRKEAEGEEEQ